MVIGEDAHAMLLVKSRFAEFADKQMCDPSVHSETILAISTDTRRQSTSWWRRRRGLAERPPATRRTGFMNSRSFHDPDGHREVVWMDPAVIAEALEATASAS